MAETAIEWTWRRRPDGSSIKGYTFNPWIGCTAVSAACDHCYAESWVKRFGGDFAVRRRTASENWRKPLKWNAEASAAGERRAVFAAGLADIFDNKAPPDWRLELWALVRATPHLDWLMLTKRPQNIAKMLPEDWGVAGYPNVWLGTTVENQEEANRRIPHLLAVPARIRFLSCEPLLGPVDLTNIDPTGHQKTMGAHGWSAIWKRNAIGRSAIDWVIAGGESGPKARPSHLDWFRSLRDQCAVAGVPFFFKQWGSWLAGQVQFIPGDKAGTGKWHAFHQDGSGPDNWKGRADHWWNDGIETQPPYRPGLISTRIGKKRAGRLLDGVLQDAYPGKPGTRAGSA